MPTSSPAEKPLLIIEGDSAKLAAQGLSCADRLARGARLLGAEPVVIKARSTADLLDGLGRATADAVFDAVVLIGHGNEDGIVLAPDRELVSCGELAVWLEEVAPERVAFICCKAGRTVAAHTLFDGLEDLSEVYASPLNMNMLQSTAIDFLLPALLNPELDETFIRAVQFGKALLAKGFLFRWTREGFEEGDDISDMLATAFETALVPVAKDLLDRLLARSDRQGPEYLPRPPC